MDKEQKQQIQDAFNSLPQVVQEAITDTDVQAQLRELAKAYSLHLDKWVVLENQIMLALVGITEPQDLPANIVEYIGLSQDKALEITKAVATIVFDPIQEKLKSGVGEAQSTLEAIDSRSKLDISKFSGATVDPNAYKPKAEAKYSGSNDPYHEPLV